ncbi:MAG: DinB family protein [Bacteroidota bacterium]
MRRPAGTEAVEYFFRYINLVEGNQPMEAMKTGGEKMIALLRSTPSDKHDFSYGTGKWTLKESILHMIDTERIMAYRALRIARGDQTPLPGFDQDDYIPFYNAAARSWDSIIDEYEKTRAASLALFQGLSPADFDRMGTASEHPISVLALAYIIAGHELHHIQIIESRYLV